MLLHPLETSYQIKNKTKPLPTRRQPYSYTLYILYTFILTSLHGNFHLIKSNWIVISTEKGLKDYVCVSVVRSFTHSFDFLSHLND